MERQIDAVSFSTDAASRAGLMPGMVRPPALVTEYMAGGSQISSGPWLHISLGSYLCVLENRLAFTFL
jgi:hypothetical protein